jgi:hypothetical protein
VRAVDVDDVERDRHTRGPTRLRHELIGNQMRRHLVEDVRDLERERTLATELPGRPQPERRRGQAIRRRRWRRLEVGPLAQRALEHVTAGEMAVERRSPHTGERRQPPHTRQPPGCQLTCRGGEDPLPAGRRIGA